ncbi:MAG: hypothetical protein FWD71_08390 [Oscillospiraceae bacterium]|nr:hypothetical protein [Oscillospiraceae bacterium]
MELKLADCILHGSIVIIDDFDCYFTPFATYRESVNSKVIKINKNSNYSSYLHYRKVFDDIWEKAGDPYITTKKLPKISSEKSDFKLK